MKKNVMTYVYLVLSVTLISGCGSSNSSDNNPNNNQETQVFNNLSKTEMAKVLSAKEEMEAVNIFSSTYQEENKSKIKKIQNNEDIFEITDDLYVMKEFPEVSNHTMYVDNRVGGIKLETETTLGDINYYKDKVGVSSVWVEGEEVYKYDLMEMDNENVSLFRKNDLKSDQFIYQNIISHGDGRKEVTKFASTDVSKSVYQSVEGQSYQSFDLFDNSSTYISYDNSLGYWQFFSSGRIRNDTMSFSTYSLCENLCYEVTFVKDNSSDEMKIFTIDIISADSTYDILSYSNSSFTLHLSGFNGVDRIEKKIENGQISGNGVTYLDFMDVYFENGKSMKANDKFVDGKLYYYNGYGVDPSVSAHSTARIELGLDYGSEKYSLIEKFDILKSFLNEVGMTCKTDLNLIMSEIGKVSYKADHLANSYKWNGYGLNNHSSLEKALQEEINKLDIYTSLHDNVKDNKEAIYNQEENNYVYAKLSEAETSLDNIKVVDNKIVVDNLNFKVKDTNTLDSEVKYLLNVAFTKGNSNVITKVLKGANNNQYTFNESNKEITINNEYLLEEDLDVDQYNLVAYLSTVDGIRATEKALLNAPINESITTPTKIINITSSDNNISFVYELNKEQNIVPSKNNYTYDELRDEISLYAFEHNYEPSLVLERQEQDEFKQVLPTDLIINGTYRMYFTNYQSEDGGFIYLTF